MKKLNYKRFLLHAGFWLTLVLLFLVIYGPVFNNFPWLFLSSMVMLPFTMVVVYTINYLLLPKFLKQKRYISLGIIVLLILILEPPLPRTLVMILKEEAFNFKNFMDYNLLPFYFETGLIIFIALSIKLFKERNKEQELKSLLEKQMLESELNALKSQLNAHFLFNTLNNLYGLAKKKSDLTAAGILMLSKMLHFVLYECSPESYSLEKELDFINNYIELEKLRYGENLKLHLSSSSHLLKIVLNMVPVRKLTRSGSRSGLHRTGTSSCLKWRIIDMLTFLLIPKLMVVVLAWKTFKRGSIFYIPNNTPSPSEVMIQNFQFI